MNTKTLILRDKEVNDLIEILEAYREKIIIMTNSTENRLIRQITDLRNTIILQANLELDINELLNK